MSNLNPYGTFLNDTTFNSSPITSGSPTGVDQAHVVAGKKRKAKSTKKSYRKKRQTKKSKSKKNIIRKRRR